MIMDLKIQDMEMVMESDGNQQRTAIATTTPSATTTAIATTVVLMIAMTRTMYHWQRWQ